MRFWQLGFLFVTVSFLELVILLQIGQHVGVAATIGLILFTGFLGAYLARQQGLRTLRMISLHLQEGRMPTTEILNGVCILIAGAFLLTPGLLTDIAGFSLLTPAFRQMLLRYVQRRLERWIQEGRVMVVQNHDWTQ